MKILQVITLSDLGGAQSVVVNLANHLCTYNDVIVVAGGGGGRLWELLSPAIIKIPLNSLKRPLSLFGDIKTLILLLDLYTKYKPDIIHLHSSKIGILGRIAFPKAKIIYTVHGFDSIRIAYRKFLPLERVLQKKCRAIVGVSKYDKKNLLAENITNNVHVIYNGIKQPVSLGCNPFEKIKGYSYRVLCIARLSPPKDYTLFLRIAALLPQYAFIWIGNQHEFVEKHPNNVYFMGSLLNAGAYNEYADLFVLPSNYEGLPMTILEAMSFGKPVVASNVGGISEIVVNDQNGYTVENTPEGFVEKIEYILSNREVYDLFSMRAFDRFQKDLTVDNMANRYMNIYNEIYIGK